MFTTLYRSIEKISVAVGICIFIKSVFEFGRYCAIHDLYENGMAVVDLKEDELQG